MGATPDELTPGAVVDGRYRVEATLGRGATSVVYAVRGREDERLALKHLSQPGRNAELRFRREYQTLARLAHPHIVAVHDYGNEAALPYYTMELVRGTTLEEARPTTWKEACVLLHDLSSALALLHARRLVHRDLSPRNVRRTSDGHAKLLDFGALATMGVGFDVVGTPPFVAPESLRRLAVDGRTDVYGLGALAHFMLTGRQAYPASRLDALETSWKTPPAPLRTSNPQVPEALEQLVASMLSLDPLGRPVSAAEVMDRLAGIAGLEAAESAGTVSPWVAGSVLVGRERELTRIRDAVRDVPRGHGVTLVIEAPSGQGKTRLLQEAALDAQVTGVTVLRATGDAAELGPFGVLRAIVDEAMRLCPDESLSAARPHGPLLAVAAPGFGHSLGVSPAGEVADPNESRLRVQQALLAWFRSLATARPIVLLVDDLQRCDEASAAFLASAARSTDSTPAGLVCALRVDEEIRSPSPVAAIREAAALIPLEPLQGDEIGSLVASWFGDLPEQGLVADFLRRQGGGSPMHCTELARMLTSRRILRHDDGRWRLVGSLPEKSLPSALSETLDVRVDALGTRARRLAEALAIQGGDIPLEHAVALYDGPEEEALWALDELIFEEIVVGSGEAFHLQHDGLREALIRGLAADRRVALHRRAAQVLLSLGSSGPEREVQIGWHLLEGERRSEAGAHLARAGRQFYETHSFRDAIAPLRAGLRILEEEKAPPSRTLELRLMLVRSGTVCDRGALLENADEALLVLRRASGLALADRLRRVLGWRGGIVAAIALRAMQRWVTPGPRRMPPPVEALVTLISLVNFAASARSLAFDVERLRPLVHTLKPLTVFHMPRMAHELAQSFLYMPMGLWGTVRERSSWLLSHLEGKRLRPLAEIDQQMAIGAARYMRAAVTILDQDPAYRSEIESIEKLDLRFFDVAANTARMLYHRLRGEEPLSERFSRQHETWRVQLGSAWAFDSQIAWMSAIAYGLTSDLPGLKRALESIETHIEQGYRLEPFAALARGDYLRERGDLAGSRRTLQAALEPIGDEHSLPRQLLAGALAETHLAEGDTGAALAVAETGFGLASDHESGTRTGRVRCGRALALALGGVGRTREAAALVDELLSGITAAGSPSLAGLLHEARARIASMQGDAATAAHHRAELERCWRGTQNPALVARWERFVRTA